MGTGVGVGGGVGVVLGAILQSVQIQCPSCKAKVLADDVSLSTRLAKCRGCNNVFEFSLPSASAPPDPAPRPAPRPSTFKVQERPGELEISWRWFRWEHVFHAVFCAVWDSFLIFWYSMAFTHPPKGAGSWLVILFPAAHVAVGVGLTYNTLAGFWNRTTVRATPERLSIHHGPIPWSGNRAIPLSELRKLHVADGPRNRRNYVAAYLLLAVTQRGEELKLLSVDDSSQAQFLKQQIESFGGMSARPGEARL